jgi:hypothetical protein
MKQVKLKFPIGKADAFASYCFDNKIRNLLSWAKDEFFEAHLVAIVAIPDEFVEEFSKSDWAKTKI